jgi:hypothetical protein
VKLIRPIEILDSRIEDEVTLDYAHTDSLISFNGSLMNGDINASGPHTGGDLSISDSQRYGAAFKGEVTLTGASR